MLNSKELAAFASLEACSPAYKAKKMTSHAWMTAELARIDPTANYSGMTRAECVNALVGLATDAPIQFGTIIRFASPNADENPDDLYMVIEMRGDRCCMVCLTTNLPLPPVLTVLVADLVHA